MGTKKRAGRYALHPRTGVTVTAARAGGPRRLGRLEQPVDAFALASDLSADGAIGVGDALDRVRTDWARQVAAGGIAESTINTHIRCLRTFVKYANKKGASTLAQVSSELVWEWVDSVNSRTGQKATANMCGLRRAAIRGFYTTCFILGLTETNQAASLPNIASPARVVSALSDAEVAQVKAVAVWQVPLTGGRLRAYEPGSLTGPVALALVLIGAQTGEVGAIRGEDLRLLDGLVFAHGGGGRYDDRWLPIDDDWAFETLLTRQAWLEANRPTTWLTEPVAYERREGTADTHAIRSAATSGTLDKLLAKAGLKQPGRVRVASINEWVAARTFASTHRVEAVAARLGMRSLDAAAHLVGHDWRPEFRTAGPGDTQ